MSDQEKPQSPTEDQSSQKRNIGGLTALGEQFSALLPPLVQILDHMKDTNKKLKANANRQFITIIQLTACAVLLIFGVIRLGKAVAHLEEAKRVQEQLIVRIAETATLLNKASAVASETKKSVEEIRTASEEHSTVDIVPAARGQLKVIVRRPTATSAKMKAPDIEIPIKAEAAQFQKAY